LNYKNLISKKYLRKNIYLKYSKGFKSVQLQLEKDILSKNKTLSVLNKDYQFNFKFKNLKQFSKFNTIAIIGMGGSILGAEAIESFLKKKIRKNLYFFNDLNEEKILSFKKKNKNQKVLFIVVSKSGNTIETITNLFLLNPNKSKKNIIIITEKKNNFLYLLSKKLNYFYIEHKKFIGGRYSVLSEPGMIPAYLMGINIVKIRSKIRESLKGRLKTFLKDSSIKLADLMNSKKFNNLIFLNYSPELEKFLFWCQQLIAESLGKKNKGFLPVISNVPKDHHSLMQLYLDGPKDKIFYVFSHENKSKKIINIDKRLKLNNFLNGRDLNSIKNAQKNALIKSFKKNNIPFREFKIKKINEETLGKLFSYFILETVIIGKLLKINPFDQPAVEQVKTYTKNLLS
tara:strand:- start:386 stop:1585 length:1200 start_codon:yes stop_codon:yes gene_type:complete